MFIVIVSKTRFDASPVEDVANGLVNLFCTMRRHLQHLALLLSRQGCEGRSWFFDGLHVYPSVWSRVTFRFRVLRDWLSVRAVRLWIIVPTSLISLVYVCYVRHGIASCTAATFHWSRYFNPNPLCLKTTWWSFTILEKLGGHLPYLRNLVAIYHTWETTWPFTILEKLRGHLPYLRNYGGGLRFVQVIPRSWFLLDRMLVPQGYVWIPRLHCCVDSCQQLVPCLWQNTLVFVCISCLRYILL
jgi:hypothetical protein